MGLLAGLRERRSRVELRVELDQAPRAGRRARDRGDHDARLRPLARARHRRAGRERDQGPAQPALDRDPDRRRGVRDHRPHGEAARRHPAIRRARARVPRAPRRRAAPHHRGAQRRPRQREHRRGGLPSPPGREQRAARGGVAAERSAVHACVDHRRGPRPARRESPSARPRRPWRPGRCAARSSSCARTWSARRPRPAPIR